MNAPEPKLTFFRQSGRLVLATGASGGFMMGTQMGVYGIVDSYRDAGPTGLDTTAARLVSVRWRIRAANRSWRVGLHDRTRDWGENR